MRDTIGQVFTRRSLTRRNSSAERENAAQIEGDRLSYLNSELHHQDSQANSHYH